MNIKKSNENDERKLKVVMAYMSMVVFLIYAFVP